LERDWVLLIRVILQEAEIRKVNPLYPAIVLSTGDLAIDGIWII
jgi:hypothetical protein